jgi:hypothetical protein
MIYILVGYLLAFLITWGAVYAYWANIYPAKDALRLRENLAFAIGFSLFQPITGIIAIFTTAFYFYGFQWWGPVREAPPTNNL